MLPISSKDTIRFTPDADKAKDKPPVFLLAVPTVAGRAQWRRQVLASGAKYATEETQINCLKDGVKAVVEDSQQSELIDVLDDFTTANEKDRVDLLPKVKEIEETVSRFYPRYNELKADHAFWIEIAPICAAQMFLKGWENVDGEFKTVNGLVELSSLSRLTAEQLLSVGLKIMESMTLTGDQAKN